MYYELGSYCFDPYQLPSLVYPQLQYNGGLFCYIFQDKNPTMEEAYPPGTRVERFDSTTNLLLAGTIMDLPLSVDTLGSPLYQIQFDNGTAASIPSAEMSSLIPPPLIFDHASPPKSSGPGILPPFLAVGSRIAYKHEGTYHKGYLTKTPAGTYRISFKMHVKKKSKDWGVDLPNLPFTWVDLYTEGVFLPGNIAHSFIRPSLSAPSP
jgi:hypothetical protein